MSDEFFEKVGTRPAMSRNRGDAPAQETAMPTLVGSDNRMFQIGAGTSWASAGDAFYRIGESYNKLPPGVGDCRDVLKSLPDESVHCIVSSPRTGGSATTAGRAEPVAMQRPVRNTAWRFRRNGEGETMKLPLKFERREGFERDVKILKRPYEEHEGYIRENDGSWVILDADGRGVIVVRFQGEAKRGKGYAAPDPEGMKLARMIVEAVNEKYGKE